MTTIYSPAHQTPLSITGQGQVVEVHMGQGVHTASAAYDRTIFLNAVRELGVLIIAKADLPEVVPGKDGDLTIGGHEGYRREDSDVLPEWSARTESLRALALAEYLEVHPPVDDQQVEALVTLLNETSDGHAQSAPNIARRLIATGKVTVQS